MWRNFIKWLLLTFICTCSMTPVLSIWCYKCSSNYDGDCLDPVNKGVQVVNCAMNTPKADYCKKMTVYAGNDIHIIRDCISQGEKEDGEGCFRTNRGDDYCRCNTDRCNSSHKNKPQIITSIVLPCVALITALLSTLNQILL